MARRRLDDEYLISGIITHGSIAEACKALRVSRATYTNRMKDPNFVGQYAAARADVIRGTVHKLTEAMDHAVACLDNIVTDGLGTSNTTRISAAKVILDTTDKWMTRVDGVNLSPGGQGMLADLIDGLREPDDPLTAALKADAEEMIQNYQQKQVTK